MSKLYVNSKVYCPCTSLSSSGTVQEVLRPSKCHSINDLCFCPSCQAPKCKYCCVSQTVKKYCVSCMTDYTGTAEIHCTKNCFTCPKCTSMLAASVKDDTLDGVAGKKFSFKCGFCDYTHDTDVITKPKPLLAIIKGEYQQDNEVYSLFQMARRMFINKLNHEILQEQLVKDLSDGKQFKGASLEVIQRLKKMNIRVPLDENFSEIDKIKLELDSNEPDMFDEAEDLARVDAAISGSSSDIRGDIKGSRTTMFEPSINNNIGTSFARYFPTPKMLTSRNSLKCADCNHELLMPTDDLLSTKFSTRWNANDHLPLITISPLVNQTFPTTIESGTSNTFLINIINPLPFSVLLNISVPSEYELNGTKVQNAIPQFSIRVGGYNTKDHTIRGIPTPYLTKETKVSRAELVMRLGKMNTNRNNDTSIDLLESLIEKSDNWFSLPMETIVQAQNHTPINSLKIPIFVTVNTRLPDSIKQLELSKKDLSYGFWTLVDIGKVHITV